MRSSIFGEGLDKDINTVDFVAKSDQAVGPGKLVLRGDLNINGISKPSTLSFNITGDEILVAEGQAIVDLDDYGIASPGMGPMRVQKKVTMKFKLSVPRSKLDEGIPVALNVTQ